MVQMTMIPLTSLLLSMAAGTYPPPPPPPLPPPSPSARVLDSGPEPTAARQIAGTLPPIEARHVRGWASWFAPAVRYTISPDGRVSECGSAFDPAFGSPSREVRAEIARRTRAACAAIRTSFRFEPAQSPQGQPVAQVRYEPAARRGESTTVFPPMPPADVNVPVGHSVEDYRARTGPRPARLRSLAIDSDDYPREALRAKQQGIVRVALLVGPDGRVQSCSLIRSSGTRLLDDAACTLLLRRTRFDPALDAQGQPTYAQKRQNVMWLLPEPPAPAENTD